MRDINPVYKRVLNKNYMIVEVDSEELQYYEYRMLEYAKPAGFITLEIRHIDDKNFIYYDISSKQSLVRILECKKWNTQDITNWIMSMGIGLGNLKTYMLSDTGIHLQPMYIYMDTLSFATELMYVPGLEMDFQKELSNLLSILIAHIDNRDEKAVRLIYSLYQESLHPESRFENLIDIVKQYTSNATPVVVNTEIGRGRMPMRMDTAMYGEKEKVDEDIRKGMEESTAVTREKEGEDDTNGRLDFLKIGNFWKHKKPKEELCTGLLSEHRDSVWILKSLDNTSDIRIDSSPFIIGRQKGLCDYILEADGVSRLHCKLEKYKEDMYLIYDLNSKNGTKVNQMLLENEEYCILHIGDMVEIAGLRYIVA